MAELKFHPLADAFPLMEGEEFEDFVNDIGLQGLRHPVVIHDGKILDGRNRWRACQRLGISATTEPYTGTDPVAFVVSENLRRRHLTDAQRAMIAATLATLANGQHSRSAAPGGAPDQGLTQREAGQLMGVSRNSVQRARIVREGAVPEVVAAVESGALPLTPAARLAALPADEQQRLMAEVPVRDVPSRVPDSRAAAQPRPILASNGRRIPQRGQRDAMTSGISTLKGLCAGFDTVEEIEPGITADEAARWARDLSDAIGVLRTILRKVRNHAEDTA